MTIPCVKNIGELSWSGTFFINTNRKKIDCSGVMVLVEHIHGQGVIDIVPDVRLHYQVNDLAVFLSLVSAPSDEKRNQSDQ